jgi:uncharacterized protein YceH (UPF0502 family)
MTLPATETTWVPLTPRERRVLGVLVEKQKTTPEGYPLSLKALVTGCNQKSARDPVTNYDEDDVEDTLTDLRKKGAAVVVEGSGRVVRYKHTLYDWLDLKGKAAAMAVLAELMLRGPQTEGDLRGRANRMDSIPDLPSLQAILELLAERGLVIYLSPPGQKRGVVVTHGLYPPDELARVRNDFANAPVAAEDVERPSRSASSSATPGWTEDVASLRAELDELRRTVQALGDEVQALKSALGA